MSQSAKHILIVEDEDIIRASLRKLLERCGYSVSEAISVKAAQESFNLNEFDLIISDLRLPGSSGLEFIRPAGPVPVLVMTSYASLRSAVDTMRQGAADYISKPFDHEEMLSAVKRIIGDAEKKTAQAEHQLPILVGNCPKVLKILRTVHRAAPTGAPVVIQGDNGTGRRTIAEIIHHSSAVSEQPLVAINCTTADEAQLSALLSGAPIGTVFLSNICELSPPLQAVALRAVEQKVFRCIASTTKDLKALCDSNRFRKDLFYSLNVVQIQVPALRDRAADISSLVQYFTDRFSIELGHKITLSQDAIEAMTNYSWPGNVKELQNMLYQSAILSEEGEVISAKMLGLDSMPSSLDEAGISDSNARPSPATDAPAGLSLEDYFTSFVLENQENMSETALAQKLGISRKSLWERRNKLGISRKKA
ncbi:MAG: sigma-54-dependent Fis family transcriptional regulator [Porticoccaceae bacterium]|jgi:two-component system, NtrC family, response regulator HydG|nr:sigma-54-dependent Fis family transcriptional regulator [Porticoccaceae bacterium]MBT5577341.1 sigma-54-dependent Fis family transcriptional regulator [Porticoccaceae bacterium]MBT7376314.1 sigma-54-dependent Fis family transcriptional regulator [Porticoccaceae bacterium]